MANSLFWGFTREQNHGTVSPNPDKKDGINWPNVRFPVDDAVYRSCSIGSAKSGIYSLVPSTLDVDGLLRSNTWCVLIPCRSRPPNKMYLDNDNDKNIYFQKITITSS